MSAVAQQIWGGHEHLCANCCPPTFSRLWKEDRELTISTCFCSSSGNTKVFLCCLVLSEYPLLAPEQGFTGSSGGSKLNAEKYSNAGDFRLCSRTKRLHYPSDVGKENLAEPWCISAEPGSCCSQRDLAPLWHRRARGKILLSAGGRGRLTKKTASKPAVFCLWRGDWEMNKHGEGQGSLGMLGVQTIPVYIYNLFELTWLLASTTGFKSAFILHRFWTLLLFQNSLFSIAVWRCTALHGKIVRASVSHL